MSTILDSKFIKWGAVLCLAFCLALLLTSPVHAEGETPPEPVPAEEVTSSEAPPAPEVPLETEALPAEETPPVEESSPIEVLVEEPTQEFSDALALAEESGVALVESSGDPYFKVGTVTYRFMPLTGCAPYWPDTPTSICTESPTPINAAISAVAGGLLPTDRKIYVEGGIYNENVKISAVADPILGQLNGLIGVDGASNTAINGYVIVDKPAAGFTLSGFTINGSVDIADATGTITLKDLDVQNTSGGGIEVGTTGSVEFNGVESSNNVGGGAEIYSSGSKAFTVRITNSEFDDNVGPGNAPGLQINASGPVTLDGVSASRNRGNGLHTENFLNLTVKNSLFNDNYANPDSWVYGHGIYAFATTASPVTLTNVVANFNENENIYVITWGGSVTATDIEVRGSLTKSGMHIDNTSGTSAPTVTVTRGVFSGNHSTGLEVYSKGNITANNIIAENNTNGSGVYLDNCLWTGSACQGSGSVTLGGVLIGTRINYFGQNGNNGLEVQSRGNVTLSNLDAYHNGYWGVYVHNNLGTSIGNVTVNTTAANWINGFWENSIDGLKVVSYGNILVDKGSFDDNDGDGAYLDNYGTSTPKTVTFRNSSARENKHTGLYVEASGNVTLSSNSSFSENGLWSGNGVSILSMLGNVSISGSSSQPTEFYNNYADGLYIDVYGTVTLNYLLSWENSTIGAYINNSSTVVRTVSVSNSNFWGNSSSGLEVYSLGSITLTTVGAHDNYSYGAVLDNCLESGGYCIGSGSVTITAPANKTNDFSHNYGDGLTVYSRGSISLTNIYAENNYGGYGAYLKNAYEYQVGSITYKSAGNVSLTATTDQFNNFSYHSINGLFVESYGNISVARLYAEHNSGCGAVLINNGSLTPKTVSVSNAWFNNNYDDGLRVKASGGITISGVQANNNSIYSAALPTIPVTVHEYVNGAGVSDYWSFDGDGSTLTITLESSDFFPRIYVSGNGGPWYDYNYNYMHYATVTVPTINLEYYSIEVYSQYGFGSYWLEVNDAGNSNHYFPNVHGLDLVSDKGGVTISNSTLVGYGADAYQNSMDGVYIAANGTINLAKVYASQNGRNGLYVKNTTAASAPVTISGAWLDENFEKGADIMNNGTVTWTTGSASDNRVEGLSIETKGVITLSGLTVCGNAGPGAELDNIAAATALAVSVSSSTFNNNQGDGLKVISKGNISLSNVNASGNSLQDYFLDISTHGETQQEHLGDYNETDIWRFSYNTGMGSIPIEVDTNGSFTPWLEIYYWAYGTTFYQYGGNHPSSGTYASYTFNPGYNDLFYVLVGGGTGHYDISINDTPDTYWDSTPVYSGVELDNCILSGTCLGTGSVTLNSTAQNQFSGNSGFGLKIQSKGAVSVTNANGNANGINGAYINNTYATAAVTVKSASATTRSTYNSNTNSGLAVETRGAITLTNLISNYNRQHGANLDNSTATTAAAINVSNSRFGYNLYDGLHAHASGAITLLETSAVGNLQYGLYPYNHDITTTPAVTARKILVMENHLTGLYVQSRGVITIDNVVAQGGLSAGVILDNNFSGATGGIVISGTYGENRFENNAANGIQANSRKAISAARITAQWNSGGSGVVFDNCNWDGSSCLGSGNVTITYTNTRNNGYDGLDVYTNGWVSLNSVTSLNNSVTGSDCDGIHMELYQAYTLTTGYPVNILNSVVQGNQGDGIVVRLKTPATPPPYKGPYIYNTAYMGNDTNSNGDKNLYVGYW